MATEFIKHLIKNIVDNRDMPKVQVERELSPILDIFMPDILTDIVAEESDKYKHILSEFPLQSLKYENNKQTNRSVNIDSLLLKNDDTLVFLELKTDDTSYHQEQCDRYRKVIEKIENNSAAFLFDFLEKLAKISSKKKKYRSALKAIESKFNIDELKKIDKAVLIYIVPKSTKKRLLKNNIEVDTIMDFTDISQAKVSKYSNVWSIVSQTIVQLDFEKKVSRRS